MTFIVPSLSKAFMHRAYHVLITAAGILCLAMQASHLNQPSSCLAANFPEKPAAPSWTRVTTRVISSKKLLEANRKRWQKKYGAIKNKMKTPAATRTVTAPQTTNQKAFIAPAAPLKARSLQQTQAALPTSLDSIAIALYEQFTSPKQNWAGLSPSVSNAELTSYVPDLDLQRFPLLLTALEQEARLSAYPSSTTTGNSRTKSSDLHFNLVKDYPQLAQATPQEKLRGMVFWYYTKFYAAELKIVLERFISEVVQTYNDYTVTTPRLSGKVTWQQQLQAFFSPPLNTIPLISLSSSLTELEEPHLRTLEAQAKRKVLISLLPPHYQRPELSKPISYIRNQALRYALASWEKNGPFHQLNPFYQSPLSTQECSKPLDLLPRLLPAATWPIKNEMAPGTDSK